MYRGLIIKESLSEDWILDYVQIEGAEIWKTENTPKYWTAIHFSSDREDFPEQLAKVLIADPARGGTWYVDLKRDNVKYIILKDHVLTYQIGDEAGKQAVCDKYRSLGIPEEQLDWAE